MNYNKSPMTSMRGPASPTMRERARPVFTMATLASIIAIGSALLIVNGCDHPSERSHQGVSDPATAIADPGPSTAPAGDPSDIQYTSSAEAGTALVSGTSTLHDWTVKSMAIKGNAEFSGQWKAAPAPTIALRSISLVIAVDSLKSTEGSGMDNTMYEALKQKQAPSISYSLTTAKLKSAPSGTDSAYHFDTAGQLTVAGAAHAVNLDLAVVPADAGGLTITTDIGMKMTDFGMKPPTAMLGVIKSGDAVTVKVTWQLMQQRAVAKAAK